MLKAFEGGQIGWAWRRLQFPELCWAFLIVNNHPHKLNVTQLLIDFQFGLLLACSLQSSPAIVNGSYHRRDSTGSPRHDT